MAQGSRPHRLFLHRLAMIMAAAFMGAFLVIPGAQAQIPDAWAIEFPILNAAKTVISLDEIVSDGYIRDSIPPIYEPTFVAAKVDVRTTPLTPVISVVINGDARAYPIAILLWDEIVNDVVGGVPIAVTYCPLCNSGVVFDRRMGEKTLVFGNTGRLRLWNMVMFDHETESWWQQFSGRAIIGDLSGATLTLVPARVESLARFIERFPDGKLLVPNDPGARPYGLTPYAGLERRTNPLAGLPDNLPEGIGPFDYAIIVGGEAWPLNRLRAAGVIKESGLVLSWSKGRKSVHSSQYIAGGSDVGNVVVQREGQDVVHDVAFAFAFDAFVPDGTWRMAP